jgi:2-polyprenyl-3-methyl-5-hydroxy-6-metoxy-1,4-benzoquinol methylase
MFTRDVRSSNDILEHYVAGYGDKRHMDGQKVNASVNRLLLGQFGISLAAKSLLDVGAGYGLFLAKARGAGARRVVGVELSAAERAYAVQELKLEMRSELGSLEAEDRFDIITLFEVVEHIPKPQEFIASITKYLNDGGSLVIGTDNFESGVVKTLGDKFPKWIPHEHISLFTPFSLVSIVQKFADLRIVGVRSFTPWELRAREFLFKLTRGCKGGKSFRLEFEEGRGTSRQYRFFGLRLAMNRIWFKMTSGENLNGEMMYVHVKKN